MIFAWEYTNTMWFSHVDEQLSQIDKVQQYPE